MKESIRELESSLRRRGVDSRSVKEIGSYLTSRKKTWELISNSFESLKKMKQQNVLSQNSQEEVALNILGGAKRMTISVFESLLSFISRPKARSSGSSFISKALSSKESNEIEHSDNALLALRSSKASNLQVNEVRTRVKALESSIQEINEVSVCVFRCLV